MDGGVGLGVVVAVDRCSLVVVFGIVTIAEVGLLQDFINALTCSGVRINVVPRGLRQALLRFARRRTPRCI